MKGECLSCQMERRRARAEEAYLSSHILVDVFHVYGGLASVRNNLRYNSKARMYCRQHQVAFVHVIRLPPDPKLR